MQPTQPPPNDPGSETPSPESDATAAEHREGTAAPPGVEVPETIPVMPPDAPPSEETTPLAPPAVTLPPPVHEPPSPPDAYPPMVGAAAEPPRAEPPRIAPPGAGMVGMRSGAMPQIPATAPVGAYPPADAAIAVSPTATTARTRGPALAIVGLLGVVTVIAALVGALGYVGRDLAAKNQLSFAAFTLDGLRYWGPALVLALIAGMLVLLVAGRRSSPGLVPGTAWLFPFVAVLAGTLLLSIYHDRSWWFVAPIVTWVVLIIGTIARVFLREPSGASHDIARTALTIVSYVVAFLALAMIYINKLRSIYSATAVTLVAILLLLQMTDGENAPVARRLVYAIAGALIIGQVTWVINYWSAAGWTGGAFLLGVFYLIAGLSAAQLRDHIGLFDVVEFGGVALLALVIVSAAVLYQT